MLAKISVAFMFLLCLAPGLQGAANPAYDHLVEGRLRDGRVAMAQKLSSSDGTGWELTHALVVAEGNAKAAPLNKAILDYHASYGLDPDKSPTAYNDPRPNTAIYHLYLKPRYRKLLSPEAATAIEDICRRWVHRHSFLKDPVDGRGRPWPLNNPTKNVWIISGSENHDTAQRSANLLSLQVLMRADAARGSGAKLHDGFTVAEHYREWLRWYQEFFRNRIREGLDCEIAHPSSYGYATISHIYEIEDLTDSAAVKKAAGNFLTVFWANVACEFEPRTGIRAGIASTRCYKFTWNQQGSIYWARGILHAYGWTDVKAASNPIAAPFFLCGYRPPEILQAIASDSKRGPYMGTARRFGRSTGKWHNGIYQVVFDDGEARNSHIRRDTWYTRDYTMSSLAFDPARDYIQLVNQSRVMGVTFSSGIDDRLVVYAGNTPANAKVEYKMTTSKGVNGMLGPDCLIAARDPNADPATSNSTRVFIPNGELWDRRREDGGWLFTRAGDGHAAIRIAGDKGSAATPTPWKSGHYLEFNDIWAPVVIQMGQAGNFDNFESFQAAVKALPFAYADGKLTYTALSGETYEYWAKSDTLPMIDGKHLDLNPPMTYDFPYLKMKHGADTATISYPGFPDLVITNPP